LSKPFETIFSKRRRDDSAATNLLSGVNNLSKDHFNPGGSTTVVLDQLKIFVLAKQ